MKLDTFFRERFLKAFKPTSTAKVWERYGMAVDWFSIFLGRLANMDDLTDDQLGKFDKWLVATERVTRLGRNGSRTAAVNSYSARLRQVRRFALKGPVRVDMRLRDFLVDIYFKERELTPKARTSYRSVVTTLCNAAGSDVMLSELSQSLLEEWMAAAPKKTRAHHLQIIDAIWRMAHELGYVCTRPKGEGEDKSEPEPIATSGDTLQSLMNDTYFPSNMRIRDEKTRAQYRFALRDFKDTLGHEPTLADLSDDNIVRMMRHLSDDKKLAPKTVNERRGRINAMWKWLASRGYIRIFPTIMPMPEPERTPQAWTREQLETLFQAADRERMLIGGIPAPTWWRMLHTVMWETGERITALIQSRCEWFNAKERTLRIPAEVRKGKRKDRVYILEDSIAEMLREYAEKPKREMLFPWPYCPSYLWMRYKILRKRAGLPTDRRSAFHRMRRSHASHLEAAGGDATEALGHSSRHITQTYLDPTIATVQRVSLFKPWVKTG